MSAASAGVSELMDAEKKASTVVAEARAARSDRLKAAKAEAGAAVDDLRAARVGERNRLGGENRLDFVRLRWRAVRRDDRSK